VRLTSVEFSEQALVRAMVAGKVTAAAQDGFDGQREGSHIAQAARHQVEVGGATGREQDLRAAKQLTLVSLAHQRHHLRQKSVDGVNVAGAVV